MPKLIYLKIQKRLLLIFYIPGMVLCTRNRKMNKTKSLMKLKFKFHQRVCKCFPFTLTWIS